MHSLNWLRSPQQPSLPSSKAKEVSTTIFHSSRSSIYWFSFIEVYRFLSSEVKAYLPSYETVTVWHLRDLAMGVKRIIYSDRVKHIDVPQFEGLSIQDIFNFASGDQDVESALPPGNEIKKLSRAYLANVIYTIMG